MAVSRSRLLLGWLGWLLLVPSCLTALAALWLLASGTGFGSDTRSTTGRVVAHEQVRLKTSQAQKSVFEFKAEDGRTLRVVDTLARQQAAIHRIGESVRVRYPAGQPEHAKIAGSVVVQMVIGGVLLLVSGVGIAAGTLFLRLRPRAAARAAMA